MAIETEDFIPEFVSNVDVADPSVDVEEEAIRRADNPLFDGVFIQRYARLTPRQEEVLWARYGDPDDYCMPTFEQVAQDFGIAKEAVATLELRAIDRIKLGLETTERRATTIRLQYEAGFAQREANIRVTIDQQILAPQRRAGQTIPAIRRIG